MQILTFEKLFTVKKSFSYLIHIQYLVEKLFKYLSYIIMFIISFILTTQFSTKWGKDRKKLKTLATHLGLAKDNVAVRGRVSEDVGLVDNEEDVLALADGDSVHTWDLLQSKLGHQLASLLFRPALFGYLGSLCDDRGRGNVALLQLWQRFLLGNGEDKEIAQHRGNSKVLYHRQE